MPVSIPKRVSAKVEQGNLFEMAPTVQFQSLKGFQPKWNSFDFFHTITNVMFQSLKGFQPKWNDPWSMGRQGVGSFNP